jgi:predicted DNA-binding protein
MKKPVKNVKVTSVRVPLDLHEKAKELGISFGAVFREGLMKKLTIQGEKEIIRNLIEDLYKEMEYWNTRLKDLERIETKASTEKWDMATESLQNSYDKVGKISSNQLSYWAIKLRVEPDELLEYFQDEIIQGYVNVD